MLARTSDSFAGPPKRVKVYIHVATMGRYQEVFSEVSTAVVQSPLAASIEEVQVHIVGDGPLEHPSASIPIRVIRTGQPVTAFEMPTLKALHVDALEQGEFAALYLNCLGGRHIGSGFEVRRAWRDLIAFELIERGLECLDALQRSDVVGIEWSSRPLPHMTSNNWWAESRYVATLPDPLAYADEVIATDLSAFGEPWRESERRRRHAGEFWIGSRRPISPISRFPLARSGLPRSELGLVPWWGMPGIQWGRLARDLHRIGRPGLAHRSRAVYFHALFGARAASRALRAHLSGSSRFRWLSRGFARKKAIF